MWGWPKKDQKVAECVCAPLSVVDRFDVQALCVQEVFENLPVRFRRAKRQMLAEMKKYRGREPYSHWKRTTKKEAIAHTVVYTRRVQQNRLLVLEGKMRR